MIHTLGTEMRCEGGKEDRWERQERKQTGGK